MTRLLCWFSCGAASAVATKLAIAQYSLTHDVEVVRCVVRDEHPDNERFAADCEKWFGQPIVNLINEKYDGSVRAVIAKRNYISGIKGAPCTLLLKKEVRERYQRPTDTHIFGYTYDSKDMTRWDNFLDTNNIDAHAPLIDRKVSHANCLSILESAGITIPVMYTLGYKHNNCIGCVKSSGAGYWNKIRIDFPEQFAWMAKTSHDMGVRIIENRDSGKRQRIYLKDLPPNTGRYQDEPEIQCGAWCEGIKTRMAEDED